ncbi:WD and tetratricopeptide repeats protein 1-like [Sycon ciliatum]|uniref:WD and tetratricopeptide repeats protein 1-like n=1 Tax=Sycon ciliatum TaxID=27933 RepID=UPI0031F60EF7
MAAKENVSSLVRRREMCRSHRVSGRLHATNGFVDRLSKRTLLQGHEGCVNCMEWNESGTLLASGSDDKTVKLWRPDGDDKSPLVDIQTGHTEIIFSVKFMPKCNDRKVVSAGSDRQVRVYDLEQGQTVNSWSCHMSRIKRIAVTPDVIFSGSEDGTVVRQDMRTLHPSCGSHGRVVQQCSNAIIRTSVPIKCIAINPVRTHLMAVGLSDKHVRLYDLRHTSNNEDGCRPTYFCPGSVFNGSSGGVPPGTMSVTYVSWSADGRKLLANYTGDQVYMFDVHEDVTVSAGVQVQRKDRQFSVPRLPDPVDTMGSHASLSHAASGVPDSLQECTAVGELEQCLEQLPDNWLSSKVGECWLAAHRMPLLPFGHERLRQELGKRSWRGDRYAALLAARTVAALRPDCASAALNVLDAYTKLRWWRVAAECETDLVERFPHVVELPGYRSLLSDLQHPHRPHRPLMQPPDSVLDCSGYFCGHVNRLTDIKEANFLDRDSKYVVAGSDDGRVYIWETDSTRLVRTMRGDTEVLNCCQPHPYQILLATSGIDDTISLWCPGSQEQVDSDVIETGSEVENLARLSHDNYTAHTGSRVFSLGAISFRPLEI